ncbi:unnamed protein product [Mytilus coruscus]|uniref:Tetraspanin n=1 Tax=Mytilus coruscus TaxID=42192 RepID=A0A6J8C861_MYTCO|nr:unnamed protein product [Mytilus coruscus]
MADLRCGASLAKVFLVIFNLLFVLIGLALVVGGALLKAGADVLDLLGEFVKQVPGLEQIATVVIGLGCAIFIIGVLGMCGACCNIRCMLVLLDHTIRKGLGTLTSKYKAPDVSNIDQTDLSSRLVDGLYISLKCCDYNNDTGVDFPPSCCKNVTRSALNAGDIKDLAACVSSPDHTNSNIDKVNGGSSF